MFDRIFRADTLRVGEGLVSGYIACFLAILSFLGVVAFHFPEYLTTPELRANYDAVSYTHLTLPTIYSV